MFRILVRQYQDFRDEPRANLERVARYAAIGTVMNFIGIALLLYITAHSSLAAWQVNLILSGPLALAGFYPNRKFAFNDRETRLGESFRKWMLQWPPTAAASQVTFVLLHDVADIRTLVTRLIVIATIGPISYTFSNLWSFLKAEEA